MAAKISRPDAQRLRMTEPATKRTVFLTGLLVLFLILCLVYNVILPVFEAPDEGDHFAYANLLANTRQLPDLAQDISTSHEIIQPPLYYALVAVLIAPFDRSNLPAVSHLNPDWFDADVNADHHSVANQYRHTAAELFPYKGAVWAVHVARLFSALLGALTVLFVYAMARTLTPIIPWVGTAGADSVTPLLAAALVALNPKFIHVSSIVSNDIAITFAATLACWWMVRQALGSSSRPAFTATVGFFILGALIGVAVLCKVTGLGLLAPAVVLLLFQAIRQPQHRIAVTMKGAIGMLAGLALIAGPWFLYNQAHYGSPLAWAQVQAANQSLLRQSPLTLPQIITAVPEILVSYWGVIGVELRFPLWVDWIFFAALVLAALGWFGLIFRQISTLPKAARTALRVGVTAAHHDLHRHPSGGLLIHGQPAWLVLAVWELALIGSYVVWLRDYVGTENSRLIFPGMALVVILVAAGWMALTPLRWRRVVASVICSGLAALSTLTPFLVIQPAFAPPPYLSDPERAALPGQSGVTLGGRLFLQHAQVDQRSVEPGQSLDVTLFWGAVRPLDQSYHVILAARDAGGALIGRLEAIPYHGRLDTQHWVPGRIFRDDYQIPIDAGAKRGIATIQLSVRGVYESPPLLPVDNAGTDRFVVGRIKVLGPIEPVAAPQHSLHAIFSNPGQPLIQLDGYDLGMQDGSRSLAFHWQCLSQPDRDYTLFVHMLDKNGAIIAQEDAQPLGGAYPTSMWDAQEQIVDAASIQLPPAAATLRIGWYDASGARLPAHNPDGSLWPDNAVLIPLPTVRGAQ
jgi:4-amino-4-deoxy-L-arabinose transferase-like glycosyltransferase